MELTWCEALGAVFPWIWGSLKGKLCIRISHLFFPSPSLHSLAVTCPSSCPESWLNTSSSLRPPGLKRTWRNTPNTPGAETFTPWKVRFCVELRALLLLLYIITRAVGNEYSLWGKGEKLISVGEWSEELLCADQRFKKCCRGGVFLFGCSPCPSPRHCGWCSLFHDHWFPLAEVPEDSRAQQLRQIRLWGRWEEWVTCFVSPQNSAYLPIHPLLFPVSCSSGWLW